MITSYTRSLFIACILFALGGALILFTDLRLVGCAGIIMALAFGLSGQVLSEPGPIPSRAEAEAYIDQVDREMTEGRNADDDAWDEHKRQEAVDSANFYNGR